MLFRGREGKKEKINSTPLFLFFIFISLFFKLFLTGGRNADVDTLKSTSSRIVMGNLLRSGTGLFSIGVRVEPEVVEQF
jgi:hypothetical protein